MFLAYKVAFSDIDKNISSEYSTIGHCTTINKQTALTMGDDIETEWQCPCGSTGSCVYLYFINPTSETLLCELAIYTGDPPCIPIPSRKYYKNALLLFYAPY